MSTSLVTSALQRSLEGAEIRRHEQRLEIMCSCELPNTIQRGRRSINDHGNTAHRRAPEELISTCDRIGAINETDARLHAAECFVWRLRWLCEGDVVTECFDEAA